MRVRNGTTGAPRLLAICVLFCVAAAQAAAQRSAAILLYHRFGAKAASTTVSDAALDQQLAWLSSHARVGTLSEVMNSLQNGGRGGPCVAITVDDGHNSDYADLFPRLRRYHLPATLFIYPSAISNASYALTWPELSEMAASGLIDVQSHTYWHPNFHVEKAHRSADDYSSFVGMQLSRSKDVIMRHTGQPVDMLAWPYGIVDAQLEQAASAAGYRFAFTIGDRAAQSGTDPLALPRLWISDSDRGARFAAKIATACPSDTKDK
jgi:peptidoglycan/xylan/chitin deacetylase (PgdA/CDA1 family)